MRGGLADGHQACAAVGLDDGAGEVGVGRAEDDRVSDVAGGGDAPGREGLGGLCEVGLLGVVGGRAFHHGVIGPLPQDAYHVGDAGQVCIDGIAEVPGVFVPHMIQARDPDLDATGVGRERDRLTDRPSLELLRTGCCARWPAAGCPPGRRAGLRGVGRPPGPGREAVLSAIRRRAVRLSDQEPAFASLFPFEPGPDEFPGLYTPADLVPAGQRRLTRARREACCVVWARTGAADGDTRVRFPENGLLIGFGAILTPLEVSSVLIS